MRRIRVLLYKMGLRPKPGSIFYSPSLALQMAYEEANRRRLQK